MLPNRRAASGGTSVFDRNAAPETFEQRVFAYFVCFCFTCLAHRLIPAFMVINVVDILFTVTLNSIEIKEKK